MGASCALTTLLVLTVITVSGAQTQYFDILQGLQQLFQPYQGNDYNINFNNGQTRPQTHKQTNRQESKKKNVDHRHQNEERRTKKPPPTNQYDYVFATTQKPSRKTTKSSHRNNTSNYNNKNEYSNILINDYYNPYEVTTKVNKVNRVKTTTTTTTESYFNYFDSNRGTTQNVFGNNFNVARPVTENVFENSNHRETFAVNNQARPNNGGSIDFNNNFSGNTNSRPQNDRNKGTGNVNNNRGTLNTDSNINFPANDRNINEFLNTDSNPGFNNFGNVGVSNTRPISSYGNTGTLNDRGSSNNNNNRGQSNSNFNNNSNRGTNNRGETVNFNNNQGTHNRGESTNYNSNNNNRGTSNTNYSNNNNRGTSNSNSNNNRGTSNSNFNNNNNRGTSSSNFNNNQATNNRGDNSNVNYNNQGTHNINTNNRPANNYNDNNYGSSNTYNNQGGDGGFHYPSDNPLINRPGVQPAPVNTALPPITNRPITNTDNFFNYRPAEPSPGFVEPSLEPEILIGPDEDDMTEWQKRRFADEAERMCDYYQSLTVKKVVALPLVPSPDPVEVNVSDCTPINVPLVIGGSVTTIREFPHMALVGWMKVREDGYSWKCGGSLISDQYILTAGHCTFQDRDANVVSNDLYSGPPQAVQLGSSYLDDPGALVVKISAVIRHPKYKMRRSYHDIAMIKMVTKVQFSEVIRPACLGRPPPVGRSIIATGWGRTEFGGDHSYVLRSVSLKVWDMQECREIWGTSLKLPNGVTSDSHMCAGDRGGGHDTCQGDSGGPAQIQDGCLWRVVAVTSYGRSCGAPDTPALYAVIPHAFIAAQVFGDSS